MLSPLLRLPLARVLIGVILVDVLATGLVYVAHRNDPPVLPAFATVTADLDGKLVDYAALPGGSQTAPDPSIIFTSSGGVRRVVEGREQFDPDSSARYVIDALARSQQLPGEQAAWVTRAENALSDVLRHTDMGLVQHQTSAADTTLGLPQDWVSAKSQGLVLSALVRAYKVTGDPRWSRAADDVFAAFLLMRNVADEDGLKPSVWLAFIDDLNFLWFEQYPQLVKPSQVVSGHMFAMLGIADYVTIATGGRQVAARELFKGGAATVTYYVPIVRMPYLAARVSPAAEERSLTEHRLITEELFILERATKGTPFGRYARDFRADSELAEFGVDGLEPRGNVDAYGDNSGLLDAEKAAQRDPDAALGRVLVALEAHNRTGERGLVREAEAEVSRVVATLQVGFVPHPTMARDGNGNPLTNPWYSARTQGLLLSALVRLRGATGEPHWAEVAASVFASFRSFRGYAGNEPALPPQWVSLVGDSKGYANLWFTQASQPSEPGRDVSRNVAGQITALFGLYDYWVMTKDTQAKRLFDGGASTVLSRLPDVRVPGELAHTDLTTGASNVTDHRLVTRQLVQLSDMTGEKAFASYARKMREDAS